MMKLQRPMNHNFKKFKKVKNDFKVKDILKTSNKEKKNNKISMKKQKIKFYKFQKN